MVCPLMTHLPDGGAHEKRDRAIDARRYRVYGGLASNAVLGGR